MAIARSIEKSRLGTAQQGVAANGETEKRDNGDGREERRRWRERREENNKRELKRMDGHEPCGKKILQVDGRQR